MNRIDEIKQEITEERLLKGWSFKMDNSKEVKKATTEFEKTMLVFLRKKKFVLELEQKGKYLKGKSLNVPDYVSFIRYLFEDLEKNRDLELTEMKRSY